MNKVALITGASGGIGQAVSEALDSCGYNLSLLDLEIEIKDSEKTLAQICNVTKVGEVEKAVSKAVSSTLEKFGRIDVVFNSAGVSHFGMIDELTFEDVQNVYDVNVRGTFNVSKAVLAVMKEQKLGYIINMGSLRGILCGKGKAAYSMSKSCVRAFSKTLKAEVERFGIKVTIINPGFVDTKIYGDVSLRPYVQSIPGQGLQEAPLTRPDDIAKTVLFLLELSSGACIEEINIGRLWGLK
jgi:NADP-dependent 3-hydroxy acid dehydrogenase YdfG